MNKNTNVCNNCAKQGHMFHQCKLPITSYGIIVFRYGSEGIQFLMLRRKDTFGFIDLIRGKYSPHNIIQLQNIIDEMSTDEKQRILVQSFDQLWDGMWGEIACGTNQYRSEEVMSRKKFELIKEGIYIDGETVTLQNIVSKSPTKWTETEWEFPKGRRVQKEKDLECALREFEEETGLPKSLLTIVENVMPFEEIYIGSNHKSYKHKYFLAFMSNEYNIHTTHLKNFQITEVSKLEWKTVDKCLEDIRPYNLEKKELISNINKVLQEYRIYS